MSSRRECVRNPLIWLREQLAEPIETCFPE